MKVILCWVPLLALAACASRQAPPQIVVQTKLITPTIPADLLDCGDAPQAAKNFAMQSDVARYLVALWAWGSECRSHLLAVKHSLATDAGATPIKPEQGS